MCSEVISGSSFNTCGRPVEMFGAADQRLIQTGYARALLPSLILTAALPAVIVTTGLVDLPANLFVPILVYVRPGSVYGYTYVSLMSSRVNFPIPGYVRVVFIVSRWVRQSIPEIFLMRQH